MIWSNVILAVNLLFAYSFLCVIFPYALLYPIIKKRSITTGLITSILASNLYIFFIGYILGYLGKFNKYTIFAGVIMLPILFRILITWKSDRISRQKSYEIVTTLVRNEYGLKLFLYRIVKRIVSSIQTLFNKILGKNKLECFLVLTCIGFSIYIYGYRKFNSYGYSTSDEEVHLYWIQSLLGNEIFPNGMYPYGMHILIAVISVLFKLNVVRVTMAFSHIILFIVLGIAYLVLRQIFTNKYGVLVAFIMYTIGNLYVSYERFHFTLPMEYGMPAIFIITAAIVSYIRKRDKLNWFLIVASIIYTLSCHFYVTAFIGIICLVMGLVYFTVLIKRRILIKLIMAGIIGLFIGLIPFLVGFLLGHSFYEDSKSWAINVITRSKENDIENDEEAEVIQAEVLQPEVIQEDKISNNDVKTEEGSLLEEVYKVLMKRFYNNNEYVFLFTVILIIFTFLYGLLGFIYSKKEVGYLFYIGLSIICLIGNIMVTCYDMGWPVPIEIKRQAVFLTYFMMILLCVPLEFLYALMKKRNIKEKWNNTIFFILSLIIASTLIYTGNIKNMDTIYYWNIQTDGAMKLVLSLMDKKENFSWTVVSPVNERSAILNSGFHYELLDLVEELDNWTEDQTIYIPTKEVYFVIEKYPLEYGLVPVNKKLPITMWLPVSYELSKTPIIEERPRSNIYLHQRREIMSKIYYWAKEYKRYYPQEMKIYYEDDEIIIYRLEQASYHLNNLSINYQSVR